MLGFEDHLKSITAPSFTASNADASDEAGNSSDDNGEPGMVYGHPDGDDGLTLEERQEIEVDEDVEAFRMLARSRSEGPFADSSNSSSEEELPTPSIGVDKGKRPAEGRFRALSDPFVDPQPVPNLPFASNQAGSSVPGSPSIMISPAEDIALESLAEVEEAQSSPAEERSPSAAHKRSPTLHSLDAPPPSEIRIFRSPSYVTDPELHELVKLFPAFITTKAKLVRFGPGDTFSRQLASSGDALKPGHGSIRLSVFEKDEGWKGGLLERLRLFLSRLFRR